MTYAEYQEFLKYPCNLDCEHCDYRAWLGDEFGCIVDIVKEIGDLVQND